eukprot:1143942-Pelagomonas_calceolata.AAC.14
MRSWHVVFKINGRDGVRNGYAITILNSDRKQQQTEQVQPEAASSSKTGRQQQASDLQDKSSRIRAALD